VSDAGGGGGEVGTRRAVEFNEFSRRTPMPTSPSVDLQATINLTNFRWTVERTATSSSLPHYVVCQFRAYWSSAAEWLARWTQAQRAWVQIAAAAQSGISLRQTVHTHRASPHQAAKQVAALFGL